jgi:hypothetical protein
LKVEGTATVSYVAWSHTASGSQASWYADSTEADNSDTTLEFNNDFTTTPKIFAMI